MSLRFRGHNTDLFLTPAWAVEYLSLMARISRVVAPGYPHHVTQRGVRSIPIVSNDNDRRAYFEVMAEQMNRYGVEVLACCLMTNHTHLIAIPRDQLALAS